MNTLKRSLKRRLGEWSSVDSSGTPLLVYHSVGSDSQASCKSPDFIAHIEFLRSRLVFATASQANIQAETDPATVAITFDDGFRDTYEVAFQVLGPLRIPFTVFVATGFIDGSADLNWSPHYRGLPPLSWTQIKEMQHYGVEIGAHTVTHPKLAACTPDQIRRELTESKKVLEDAIGCKIASMAYPFGQTHDVSSTVLKIVAETGYERAYTTIPDLARSTTSCLLIPRITVDADDDVIDVRQKVEGRRTYMRNYSRFSSVLTGLGLRRSTSSLRT